MKIENTNKFQPNNNNANTYKPNYMKAQHKNENVNQTTRNDLLNTNKSVVKLQIGEQTNTKMREILLEIHYQTIKTI